jgi:hypothetical protein
VTPDAVKSSADKGDATRLRQMAFDGVEIRRECGFVAGLTRPSTRIDVFDRTDFLSGRPTRLVNRVHMSGDRGNSKPACHQQRKQVAAPDVGDEACAI